MPLTILSPYSGRPVKMRDQDVGRAIRDEEDRIFYVVPRSDGNGFYAAPTRKGSQRDEERYLKLQTGTAVAAGHAREQQQAAFHDARGPGRRPSPVRLLVLLLVLIALVVAGWYAYQWWTGRAGVPGSNPVLPNVAPPSLPTPIPSPTLSFPLRIEPWRRAA